MNHRALLILLLVLAFLPNVAAAATLYVSPASGTYEVGEVVSVRILVSSDQSVNAVSGSLSFSNDTLTLSSISKSGSFVNFWTQEPTFSNGAGTIDFEGVSLGSGYSGSGGTVITITFRAKAPGTARVSFTAASILANDGQGTDVTEAKNGASFSVRERTTPGPQKPQPQEVAPPAPLAPGFGVLIFSSTHPNQQKWYDNNSPRFYWTLPANAREVRVLLDSNPKSMPTKSYAPAISSKIVEDLPDGTHYFHLQVRTDSGWSAVSHFKVNIDTSQPDPFSIVFPHGSISIDPQPIILFNTTDAVSGVAYYEVKVGDGGPLKAAAAADSNPYALPLLDPGRYVVYVTAYDEAGNATSAESELTIEGIEHPTITSYPSKLTVGDFLAIRGTTYQNATVEIALYDKDGERIVTESTKSNSFGDFEISLSKRLAPGEYAFTTRVTDSRGARSVETDPIAFSVTLHLIADALTFVTNYFVIVVIFGMAIFGIATVGLWGIARLTQLRASLVKEVTEAETTVKKSFALLKSDLAKHIKRLHAARKNRPLTEDELLFLEDFERDLEEAERIIRDEVDDIPKL